MVSVYILSLLYGGKKKKQLHGQTAENALYKVYVFLALMALFHVTLLESAGWGSLHLLTLTMLCAWLCCGYIAVSSVAACTHITDHLVGINTTKQTFQCYLPLVLTPLQME